MAKKDKKPKDKLSRFYFWMFVILGVLAAFLFWSVRDIAETEAAAGSATTLVGGIIASLLAIFFGALCFRRFLRKKSIAGGLFLTMSISTASFMITSRMLRALLPPAIFAIGQDPGAAMAGEGLVLMFAQIGLFALWFAILLYTIYIYVRPVKRIEKYLARISDGEKIKNPKIGRAEQYRSIEGQLKRISDQVYQFKNQKQECSPTVKFVEPVQKVENNDILSPCKEKSCSLDSETPKENTSIPTTT